MASRVVSATGTGYRRGRPRHAGGVEICVVPQGIEPLRRPSAPPQFVVNVLQVGRDELLVLCHPAHLDNREAVRHRPGRRPPLPGDMSPPREHPVFAESP
jgi:hypothetical protein